MWKWGEGGSAPGHVSKQEGVKWGRGSNKKKAFSFSVNSGSVFYITCLGQHWLPDLGSLKIEIGLPELIKVEDTS